ncbi:MAG: glucosyl-3-phosphoglycerate synthase [Actinomycetota bacterium]|nr:glucosyl-3-phosphoglycerate synthase [Actinomycetota bacterium]
MKINERDSFAPSNARDWFERRSYGHEEFKDVKELAHRKRELGLTVSLVLPSRNVADTVGGIIETVNILNEEAPLVEQIMVVDADSTDGTAEVAASKGAVVYSENELLSNYGDAHGKGDAMWRSLSVARGDLVMFADADTKDFKPQFIYGTLGPIITVPGVRFVKGAFRRPFKSNESVEEDGGGRVTELTTKPLFNLFYPELTGFVQPLAGEFVADKELFSSIPFLTGYAVETGIMIDVLKKVGLGAMSQVDLGTRQNRHQSLFDLGRMSYSALRAVARRLRQEGRLQQVRDPSSPDFLFQFSDYLHAVATSEGLRLREYVEELVERPPMSEVLAGTRD